MKFGAAEEAEIDELYEWFQQNPKLPKEIDRILLKRFYRCMYGDIKGTKKLIQINYGLRNKHSHIFLERDPTDSDSKQTFDYADLVPLPGLTAEGYKVNHTADTKAFFMVSDCRFNMYDGDVSTEGHLETFASGEVQIFDMNGYTLKHLSKMTFSTLRIYMAFLQEALPVHLKAIHIINCPSYLDKVVSIMKPFISREVFKLIHFHTVSLDSLYEHVPRSILPEEYGGNGGKLADLKAQLMAELSRKREYLMDPNHWKVGGEKENAERRRWPFK
ncbi:alpha-tocopherol transfer protein-like isoform X2 [Zeugodacus cucurbitae]|uniref:alpha-tocopherol transfer protein-like isoform X2 n=1 Tax=Zeugodacus cucurbitae TaxID=28588 RepID=UPI0023D967DA|nr:alpha-tocopherol transfer protein-like isoform X2 [Zeugodacus cucurbitae]